MTFLCCIPPGIPRHTLLRALILNMVCCPNKEIYDSLSSLLDRLSLPSAAPQPQTAVIVLDEADQIELATRKNLLSNIPFILATDLDGGELAASLLPVRPRAILPLNTDPVLLITYIANRMEHSLAEGGMSANKEEANGKLGRGTG